jgi:glycosyltransferase involved in cell wall biosynthesis
MMLAAHHTRLVPEMKICALIPAFNEADRIASVVLGARKYVEEVVLVDDGSGDGTAAIAKAAGAVCLRLEKNQGKAAALRQGIAYVREREFTHILFLDGDGQHAAEDIPALIRAASETNADLVIGARSFDRRRMPRARYYSNTIGSRVASWLVGREIKDSQCGFRLVNLDKLRQIKLSGKKYEFEMEVLIKMSLAGSSVVHVPVHMIYDQCETQSKMRPVWDTVRICLWSLRFRFARL